jgi:hypothetical protein
MGLRNRRAVGIAAQRQEFRTTKRFSDRKFMLARWEHFNRLLIRLLRNADDGHCEP